MRLSVLVTAVLLLWDQSAHGGCLISYAQFFNNGISSSQWRARAGQLCLLHFTNRYGYRTTLDAVQISVPPSHGTLYGGVPGGRGILTYRPAGGFAGTDRFKVIIRYTILRLSPEEIHEYRPSLVAAYERHLSTEYEAEVVITP